MYIIVRKKLGMVPFAMLLLMIVATACADENNTDHENTNDEDEAEGDVKITMNDNEKIEPKQIAEAFLKGSYENIYAQTGDAFQEEIDLEELEAIGEDFDAESDSFSLASEMTLNGATIMVWTDDEEEKGLTASVDDDDMIQGLHVQPLESHPETDETLTSNTFSFPFDGEWFVFWGGTNTLENYHYAQASQRYAYDFIVVKDNQSYSGDPEENENYYAFGKDVLAPAEGEVVDVVNDVEDNVPGEMNEAEPAGNRVIIDHGDDEYSLLAHFQEGSIEVEKGDDVKQGDMLGSVGNSGNSSEPHIHFHVADEPSLIDGDAIRIQFEDDADPRRGEVLQGVNE